MVNAAKNDGISLDVVSGFRSYETQNQLYNGYVSRDGKEAADTYSARPGHSEHQTGLAFDVNLASDAFNNTPMKASSYIGKFGSIYVPAAYVDSYKSSTNWSIFSSRIVGY